MSGDTAEEHLQEQSDSLIDTCTICFEKKALDTMPCSDQFCSEVPNLEVF